MTNNELKPLSIEWFEDDMKEYEIARRGLPMLTTSNCSPEVMQHIAFQGEEIVRLRRMVRHLALNPTPESKGKS